jgi:thiol-disulfide isomerase/thioredoxin
MPRWVQVSAILGISMIVGALVSWLLATGPSAASKPSGIAPLVDFHLNDLAGRPHSVTEWRGKFLLINFWATWCAPCRREMPLLQTLHQDRAQLGPAVIGVAIDRQEPVQSFIAESGVTYPILIGQQEAMQIAASLVPDFAGLPLSVIVAPDGELLHQHLGELHAEDLREIVAVIDAIGAGRLSLAAARQRLHKRLKQG